MPNFGNVGRELAKEIGDEPEVDEETEDESTHACTHGLLLILSSLQDVTDFFLSARIR
jgi:hypothetical protein